MPYFSIECEHGWTPKEAETIGRLPYPIVKAFYDSWNYMLGTRTGMAFRFGRAELDGEWIRLLECRPLGQESVPLREIDIRIDQIEWAAEIDS